LHFLIGDDEGDMNGLRVKALWVSGLCVDDFSVNIHRVFILERWKTSQHLVDKDAESPPVDRFRVALIEQYLRCYVLRGAADGVGALADDLSEAEVDELEVALVADHDVLRLQVAVDDVLPVQVLEDANYLSPVESIII
jgi:hypothetical protein